MTKSEWIRSSKRNPCGLCGNTSGWCSTSAADDDTITCKTTTTAPQGWKKLKDTNDGGGVFKLTNGENYTRPERTESPKTANDSKYRSADHQTRDRVYRRLISNNGDLGATYRDELERRGLSSEQIDIAIERDWFSNWQRSIDSDFYSDTENVAGIDPTTGKTCSCEGLFLPAIKGGSIVGGQIYPKPHIEQKLGRPANVPDDLGKYIWLSSSKHGGANAHCFDTGENPLFLREHPDTRPDAVENLNLCEGALKSAIAYLKFEDRGQLDPFLGASGGHFSTNEVKQCLDRYPNIKTVTLYPDAGSTENPSVVDRYLQAIELIRKLTDGRVKILVAWWGQLTKADREVDELTTEDLENLIIQPWENSIMGETVSTPSVTAETTSVKTKTNKKGTNGGGLISTNGDGDELSPASDVAKTISANVKSTVIFDNQCHQWRVYEAKKWQVQTDESIKRSFHLWTELEDKQGIKTFGRVKNVVDFARSHLFAADWQPLNTLKFIPFNNGIYDVEKEVLLDHSPSLNTTWYLPRDYHSGSDVSYPLIDKFLDTTTNNDGGLKNIIIAFCNAILKGRSDLQKILYLFGSGGNGKGSLMRLMTMLVGQQNTHSTSIHSLCNNRFELANIYEKRLVLCPDEYKQTGGLTALKSLSGEDLISGEKKGRDAFQFRFNGLAVIASNESIFKSDSSFGLERRLVRVPLEVRISDADKRTNLELDFEFDLPAFTSYLLMLDDDWVTKTIRDAGKHSEVVRLTNEQNLMDNSIAAFVDECLIHEPDPNVRYLVKNMYAHYKDYCDTNGLSAKSKQNFTKGLEEWLTTSHGKSIKRIKGRDGVYIPDFRKRNESDDIEEVHPEKTDSTISKKVWEKPTLKSSHRHSDDSKASVATASDCDVFITPKSKRHSSSENPFTATVPDCDVFGDDFLKTSQASKNHHAIDSTPPRLVPEGEF